MKFRHINDIEDWLEPLDYETFWEEIRPYCLVMLPRKKCDADIESGVDEETILYVLKSENSTQKRPCEYERLDGSAQCRWF